MWFAVQHNNCHPCPNTVARATQPAFARYLLATALFAWGLLAVPQAALAGECTEPYGDITGDGHVGVDDLLMVIAAWGAPYDVNDVLTVIELWGPCP